MKKTLALLALVAATIGTAAAQRPSTAGSNTGGNSSGGNANNTVSSGNSSNTSSSATNNNPTTSSPNYKPAAKPRGTGADTKKPSGGMKGSTKMVVQSGGQGHNSTPDPKGKTLVAPSASTSGKKK
ncbi:MAG: hypothetical protein EOO36_11230 [Cytophagaceae bacterium]|nr:MAG: hypothetical protein EOO36_11230 [Cytophagaceae bacterium]